MGNQRAIHMVANAPYISIAQRLRHPTSSFGKAMRALYRAWDHMGAALYFLRLLSGRDEFGKIGIRRLLSGMVRWLESACGQSTRVLILLDGGDDFIPVDRALALGMLVVELVRKRCQESRGMGLRLIKVGYRRWDIANVLSIESDLPRDGATRAGTPYAAGLRNPDSALITMLAARLKARVVHVAGGSNRELVIIPF